MITLQMPNGLSIFSVSLLLKRIFAQIAERKSIRVFSFAQSSLRHRNFMILSANQKSILGALFKGCFL